MIIAKPAQTMPRTRAEKLRGVPEVKCNKTLILSNCICENLGKAEVIIVKLAQTIPSSRAEKHQVLSSIA